MDESGEAINVVDRRRDQVMERAKRQATDPLAFLEDRDLFDDLADHPRFTTAYLTALESLHAHGARATLEDWRRRSITHFRPSMPSRASTS